MADKKITDLQLIAAITGDESMPADDGIQTYRATPSQMKAFILANQNILFAMLKEDIFNSATAVTPADNDYFPLVDTSDSNKTKRGLVGSFRNSPFRSVSSTDTATSADETLVLSGASFTQTLPANGTAGKKITLIHNGNTLSQKYTIATQGGATIGGIASGSFVLCTKGETLGLQDDGTNWIITYRDTSFYTRIANGVSDNVTAVTTNPTRATSRDFDYVDVTRRGRFAKFVYRYSVSSTTGASAGSGAYIFGLPKINSTQLTMDTTIQPNNGGSSGDTNPHAANSIPGFTCQARSTSGPTGFYNVYAHAYSATQFQIYAEVVGSSTNQFFSSSYCGWNEAIAQVIEFEVPIADWQD